MSLSWKYFLPHKTDNHKYSLEFHTLSWRAQRRKKAAQAIEGLRRNLYGRYRQRETRHSQQSKHSLFRKQGWVFFGSRPRLKEESTLGDEFEIHCLKATTAWVQEYLFNLYPADNCLGLDVGEERSREYPDPDLSFVKSLMIIFKGCRPFSQSDIPPQMLSL